MNKAIKTKNQISKALIELLNNKPLDLITIKELAKKAEISRTAFYNNFNNLDDVLKYIYQRAHKQIFKEKYSQLEYVYSDEHILDMISFFDKNSKLLLVLIKWNLIELIAKYNTEIVLGYTQHYKNKFIREHAFYFISYYNGSLFNICTYWITNGKQESIETLFKIIKEFEKIKFIQKAI
ncbi:TetR/AcrR family transcriptional regulator [Faecalibacillus intestinalis]|uniref:TetR/AcrR family transcriptional regulator n=1 Tax=Faecalibacillus intestinalis TaxID=1982626 RepID=UPI0039922613